MTDFSLTAFLTELVNGFTDPQKRVFWGWLLSGFAFGLLWLLLARRQSLKSSLSLCFSKAIWWSASARADYLILVINKFTFLLIAPLLMTQLALATWLFQTLYELIGSRPILGTHWPAGSIPLLFTLSYLVLDDFFRFYLHKLLHEIPALWAFHKVHHSARTMTPITVFRAHPVEGLLFSLRTALVQGICIGIFIFFFGSQADLITVWGASIFSLLFNLLGSNLRHSHVPLHYPRFLERFLISPAMHQIHHSTQARHFNKNYGVIFSFWDRMSHSWVSGREAESLQFGLSETIQPDEHSLTTLYLKPFAESYRSMANALKKGGALVFPKIRAFRKIRLFPKLRLKPTLKHPGSDNPS